MKKSLRFTIIFLGIVLMGIVGWRVMMHMYHKGHMGLTYDIPMADFGPLSDFNLPSEKGKNVGLNDLKGKPWVANFIFTRCTGPCPVMSSHMSSLVQEFSKGSNLNFISFTVDPQYDTPEVLRAYSKKYEGDKSVWHFLTGETKNIHEIILEGFRLAIEENRDPNIAVGEKINHSLHFVLVDKKGHVRGYYNGYDTDARERLNANIKTLLSEHDSVSPSHS